MSNNYVWGWNDGESTGLYKANTLGDIIAEVISCIYVFPVEIEINVVDDDLIIKYSDVEDKIENSNQGVVEYLEKFAGNLDLNYTFEIMCN